MIFFASVSFIALPLTAFIYMDNLVVRATIDKRIQQLENKEKRKDERTNSKVDGTSEDDSRRD